MYVVAMGTVQIFKFLKPPCFLVTCNQILEMYKVIHLYKDIHVFVAGVILRKICKFSSMEFRQMFYDIFTL